MTTREKLSKVLLYAIILILLAIYLNIGWGLGHYYNNYVFSQYEYREAAPWHAKLLGGHCVLFFISRFDALPVKNTFLEEFSFSVLWPLFLVISLVSWIIHLIWWFILFLWWAIVGFWHFLLLILWLIFAGGLFRLASGIP